MIFIIITIIAISYTFFLIHGKMISEIDETCFYKLLESRNKRHDMELGTIQSILAKDFLRVIKDFHYVANDFKGSVNEYRMNVRSHKKNARTDSP